MYWFLVMRSVLLPARDDVTVVKFFFFNDTATTEIYTLSLHDALPISCKSIGTRQVDPRPRKPAHCARCGESVRSEEHTSELQSRRDLVCRLLLEKKNQAGAGTGRSGALNARCGKSRNRFSACAKTWPN